MKHRSIYLTLLLWCFLCIGNLWAYDFEKDGIYYNITSSEAPYTVEVTYSGTMLAASILDSSLNNQTISVTEEEYDGVFCSRQFEWASDPKE